MLKLFNMYYENELGYLNLLKDTINQGESVKTRNGTTISKFGSLLKFTNIENLPVITTKKIFLYIFKPPDQS